MTEFWLVSAPGENTPQKTWDRLNQATAGPEKLSVNYKFSIPELRVTKKYFCDCEYYDWMCQLQTVCTHGVNHK